MTNEKAPSLSTERLALIVDPDTEVTKAVTALLQNEGYQTVSAQDGETAWKICQERLPSVVILEGLLPKLNGIELATRIRGLPDGGLVGIILVSAVYSGAKFKPQIKAAQIDDVVPKPFLPHDLIQKVRSFGPEIPSTKGAPETPEPSSQFPHSGYLTEVPFIRLVFFIFSRKETGTLRLQNADTKKLVTFENGEPRFVVSNLEKECLGQLLVKRGRLSPEECAKSLELMAQLNSKQGETLIQMGVIEPFELDEALKSQAREKFCEIFGWRQGQFLFVPGKVFRREMTPVDLSVEQLCLRGVKEYYNLAEMDETLGPFAESKPALKREGPFRLDAFKLATWDMKITQLIRHGEPVVKIVDQKIAREVDVYHLFFTLFMLDVIEFSGARPPVEKAVPIGVPVALSKYVSPFERIGVAPTASDEEIRKAFENKMKELEGRPSHELAPIQEAFEQIATLQGRRDYLKRAYGEMGELPREAKDVFRMEEFLEVGKHFLDLRRYAEAEKVFTDAAHTFAEDGLGFTYLGYSTYLKLLGATSSTPEEKERARKIMMKGIKLSPYQVEGHYLLGKIFSMEKDFEKASVEFQRALDLEPKHVQAASELRLAQMRVDKQKKNQSFIKWKK